MAHLVTAANERYYGRIAPYVDSLKAHCQIPATLVCVGDRLYPDCPINTVLLPQSANGGAPGETESPQHGSFLQVLGGPDDEVIIFTDGDILMQRPFTAGELELFDSLPVDRVAAGYNSGPAETLEVEAGRLYPRAPIREIGERFGLLDRPCYNIGVFAARRSTYRAIWAHFLGVWPLLCEAFGHSARQQWGVVWTVHMLGIGVAVTPYSLHANGHYGIPPGCYYRDDRLYAGDDLVCLRHKL